MQILVPSEVACKFVTALDLAERHEIGGIMMGEHIDKDKFRIVEITIQSQGGTYASFVRLMKGVTESLRSFFSRTQHDYVRFNYLGEWHSHPNFALIPSSRDARTMHDIVMDPESKVNFAILLLVRIGTSGLLESSATLYLPGLRSAPAEVFYE